MRRLILMISTLLIFSDLTYAGNPYYPLQVGWQWSHVNDAGSVSTREIVGTTTIIGHEVFIMRHPAILVDAYYSTNSSGDLLYHGSAGPTYASYYDPPLVLILSGASPGVSWISSCQTYCDPEGRVPNGPIRDYRREIVAYEEISVPAGQFLALKIQGTSIVGCSGESLSVGLAPDTFKALSATNSTRFDQVNYWFVEGIGLGKVEIPGVLGGVLYLDSWTEPSVATSVESWGSLKAKFR